MTKKARTKHEASLLGKVSLDTCPFILGYIAKYPRILFQGCFLPDSPLSHGKGICPFTGCQGRYIIRCTDGALLGSLWRSNGFLTVALGLVE